MAEEIKLQNIELNRFITDERNKVVNYLRKKYSISDDDISDIEYTRWKTDKPYKYSFHLFSSHLHQPDIENYGKAKESGAFVR